MLPNWHRGWFYQKHGQITLEVLKILSQRSGEMAQHNNTATPDGLSLVPRTHMMGGQNHFLSYPLIYTYVRHGFTLLFQNSNKGFKKRCIPNLHRAKQTVDSLLETNDSSVCLERRGILLRAKHAEGATFLRKPLLICH